MRPARFDARLHSVHPDRRAAAPIAGASRLDRGIRREHTRLERVNLAVDDLERSTAFFKHLGFSFNPQFTNDQGACMIIGENIYAMLLVKDFFKTFTSKALCDATRSTETLVCLSCESRAEVDAVVAKALAAGGRAPREPQDHGFMYGHGFEDLDGHIWELVHMDPNAACPN